MGGHPGETATAGKTAQWVRQRWEDFNGVEMMQVTKMQQGGLKGRSNLRRWQIQWHLVSTKSYPYSWDQSSIIDYLGLVPAI